MTSATRESLQTSSNWLKPYNRVTLAAGRPKDLIALPELEAIQEAQAMEGQKEL